MEFDAKGFFAAKLSGRKFWLVVFTFLISTHLLIFHVIDQHAWLNVVEWVVAAYVVGSIAEKSKFMREDATLSPQHFVRDAAASKTPKQGPEHVEQ